MVDKADDVTEKTIEDLRSELELLKARLRDLEDSELSQLAGDEAPYLNLIDSMGTVVFLYQDNRLQYVNREAIRIIGYSREELLEISMFDLIHPDDREKAIARTVDKLADKPLPPRFVARVITRTGDIRWFSFGGRVIEYQNRPAVLTFGTDITELQHAQAAMHQSDSMFRALAETTPAAIFLHKGARMTYANPAAVAISGYTREELLEKGFWETVHPDYKDMVRARSKARVDGDIPPSPYEIKIVTKNGEERWLEIMGTPLELDGEISVLGTGIDITYRKTVEQEMLRTQKLESLGILAGGIAHDFNNIMTTILGNLSLARTQLRKRADIESATERLISAEKAVLSARHLTQQLLTFSKGGEPVTEPMDLDLVLEETAALALSGTNVEAVFHIADDLQPVDADIGQITQVVSNLVINAVQAMPEGGTVEISADNISVEEDEIPNLQAGNYAEFIVADRGCGIPEDQLSRVFDPYFTTKPGGTGLGLSASYSIIVKHQGLISIESQVSAGTSARVMLPASGSPSRQLSTIDPSDIAGSGRILMMDDDESVRSVAIELLLDEGYDVVGAKDGSEAIELYREAMGKDGQPFEAVILDLTVPGGMGGKETIQGLLKLDANVRALVSSGYSNDPILAEYEKHGFCGVVAKPYSSEELSRAVDKVISRRP